MKALLLVLAIAAAAGGAKWWMETANILEFVDPATGDYARTSLGIEVHSHLRRVIRVSLVLAVWTLIDLLWLPWLKIEHVAKGVDGWLKVAPPVRAAIVAGWFIALSAFVLSFSLGI
ncbi:MAG: hypothetical protein OXI22_00835 [Defluviicoccus sp.]|nr:hypothetical protein [Defluviicoccus sp.]